MGPIEGKGTFILNGQRVPGRVAGGIAPRTPCGVIADVRALFIDKG